MNHLVGQKSPYLLQHADNPVDWYPWSDAALETAKREGKLIFLSIGYATCHWCHVMEKESFVDEAVAALMNRTFVSIKVDREERPDLDAHFMEVCRVLTGSGGWPLTIVMTPDARPFFAATYIPREKIRGRVGMLELVPAIVEAWDSRNREVIETAAAVSEAVRKLAAGSGGGFEGGDDTLALATEAIARVYDDRNGGFGSSPKFPMPTIYPFLIASQARSRDPLVLEMVEKSLHAMRNGGIYDQLGYGFHRYSTDAAWRVPHFEKMLYDQALLSRAFTEAWLATGKAFYRRTSREVLAYVLSDLSLPEGGFASAEDADSEGGEGRFYTWEEGELRAILGPEGFAAFAARYKGLEGGSAIVEPWIPRRDPGDEHPSGEAEALLLSARSLRPRPLRDDKLLVDWNGLMIAALARAGAAFDAGEYLAAAERAAAFILERLRTPSGALLHRYRDGEAAVEAFADDYAFMALGLYELYEATFEPRWLDAAKGLMERLLADFWDEEGGAFFQSRRDSGSGLLPRKIFADSVLPSANSVALLVMQKLALLTADRRYAERAEALLAAFPKDSVDMAVHHGSFLSALDFARGPAFVVVVAGDPRARETAEMLKSLHNAYIPRAVVLHRSTAIEHPPILRHAPYAAPYEAMGGRTTAYVCSDYACERPTHDVAAMLSRLGASPPPSRV